MRKLYHKGAMTGWLMKRSMREQFMLFCVLVVVLPTVAVSLFTTINAALAQMTRAREDVRSDVQRMTERFEMKAQAISRFIRVVSFDTRVPEYAAQDDQDVFARIELFNELNEMLMINMSGEIRNELLYTAMFFRGDVKPVVSGITIGIDAIDRNEILQTLDSHFQETRWEYRWMRASDLAIEGLATGAGVSDMLLVASIVPIRSSNEGIGYLVMSFRREFFESLAPEEAIEGVMRYVLVDSAGRNLMIPGDQPIVDLQRVLWCEAAGGTFQHEDRIYSASRVPETNWHLIGSLDWISVVRHPLSYTILNLMVLLSLVMFVLCGAILLVRNLTEPLVRISVQLPLIAEMQPVEIGADMTGRLDEVGMIARSVQTMQREVQESFDRIQKKNYELERFTYTVSHDLKSPLITIKGFAGSIARDIASGRTDRMQSDIVRIRSAADKMQNLLDDLLELSRVGRIVNPSEMLDMDVLVQEVLELLNGVITSRMASIEIETALPSAWGDRRRIMEVWQNLIENALKFAKPGQAPHIRIGFKLDAEQGTGERGYYVRDEGIGIDPMHHEKIFGLFDKINPDSEGTGIGLALVRRILELHGGTLFMNSTLGNGCTFWFILPERPVGA